MAGEVDDIQETIDELRRRGVIFDQVALPGLETIHGIAEAEGNYPSRGRGERAAWFVPAAAGALPGACREL